MINENGCACGSASRLSLARSRAVGVGAVADQAARRLTGNGSSGVARALAARARNTVIVLAIVAAAGAALADTPLLVAQAGSSAAVGSKSLPRLVDLGAGECEACKLMTPVLEGLKQTYAGRLEVEYIDILENPGAIGEYGISVIPTQVFYSAAGKELFRHEGFISTDDILAKWTALGVTLAAREAPGFSRWEPARQDTRAQDAICYMCDGDVKPRSKVVVKTAKGDVNLCSPHCYFIMYSCLTEDRADFESKVTATDWTSGASIPLESAVYLHGLDETNGRPMIKAFAERDAALAERTNAGGSLIGYSALRDKELSSRCGFCDRACYPEDAALVKAGGVHTWGCCSHCALGVAARTGKDIEVHQPDRLTGEMIIVRTLDGSAASIEPPTAVAWFGQRTKPDGKRGSAGCFHQGFFVSPDNLKMWVKANPLETGEMITIHKALSSKMALTAQQISGACKIGECAPK